MRAFLLVGMTLAIIFVPSTEIELLKTIAIYLLILIFKKEK
ncbi:MAG: hypothetical protein AABY22_13770 [Nanoarchaeota archaeon]